MLQVPMRRQLLTYWGGGPVPKEWPFEMPTLRYQARLVEYLECKDQTLKLEDFEQPKL